MGGQLLAVSLGDPAGIGPELIAAAWAQRAEAGLPPFVVVGGAILLAKAAASRGLHVPVRRVHSLAEAEERFDEVLPVVGELDCAWTPGEPSREGAELALASLSEAARLTAAGEVDALVTGPISKARLAEVGFTHPGQTEFVAAAAGTDPGDAVMMLAGPNLRTVPLTVHIPLGAVPAALSAPMIERKGRIVALALMRDFGIASPRLAFAALNPHAGEEGRMGDEEARLIEPAIARMRAEGIAVSGPHPADALFAPRAREHYDAALCMYHDQALIPLKALDFDSGVNVTLGLPIIRTSPDHGTAFAIAGKNQADPGATIAAIRMAGDCARRRFGG
jgi:4-hydroxythreonine-4-phosphate dehydrogenase